MSATMGKVLPIRIPGAGRVAQCERCGDPCKVADERDPQAQLLRLADVPVGYCVNCAVSEYFWVKGCRDMVPGTEGLRRPEVQAIFANIMRQGRADAKPPEINWEKVIAHWDLSFRVGKRMVSPVEHPLPPPIRRARKKKAR